MFVKHEHLIINTSNITYISVRENLKHLIIHFDNDHTIKLTFESLKAWKRWKSFVIN
ncbi:hypothetical protein NLHDIDDJ_02452 [Acinetobacter baumannii]|nr:hypothetical protein NLHDIDDJ_02452 [Acinetobacter baumannii]